MFDLADFWGSFGGVWGSNPATRVSWSGNCLLRRTFWFIWKKSLVVFSMFELAQFGWQYLLAPLLGASGRPFPATETSCVSHFLLSGVYCFECNWFQLVYFMFDLADFLGSLGGVWGPQSSRQNVLESWHNAPCDSLLSPVILFYCVYVCLI